MTDKQPGAQIDVSTLAARSALRTARIVGIVLAVAGAAALAVAFIMPARQIANGGRPRNLMEGLLVILFVAATIVSLGIGWTANIVAARVYRRGNPHPSAVIVAISQVVVFAAYMAVVALVICFRVKAGGPARSLASGIASILAGLYFLKPPDFLAKVLHPIPGGPAKASRGEDT